MKYHFQKLKNIDSIKCIITNLTVRTDLFIFRKTPRCLVLLSFVWYSSDSTANGVERRSNIKIILKDRYQLIFFVFKGAKMERYTPNAYSGGKTPLCGVDM